MVEAAGRVGSSRVVLIDSVEVGVVGSVGRLADSNENVRLQSMVSRREAQCMKWETCDCAGCDAASGRRVDWSSDVVEAKLSDGRAWAICRVQRRNSMTGGDRLRFVCANRSRTFLSLLRAASIMVHGNARAIKISRPPALQLS